MLLILMLFKMSLEKELKQIPLVDFQSLLINLMKNIRDWNTKVITSLKIWVLQPRTVVHASLAFRSKGGTLKSYEGHLQLHAGFRTVCKALGVRVLYVQYHSVCIQSSRFLNSVKTDGERKARFAGTLT